MGLRYEILKKKYERLYNETLEKNKEILIESFVEYYGEKHRDEIVSRFNEITFIYFIDWERYSNIIKKFSFKNEDRFMDIKKFLKYRKKNNGSFKDRFVGSSNKKFFKDKFIVDSERREYLKEVFSVGNPSYNRIFLEGQINRLIFFPILVSSEVNIIHEINHALTDSVIAIVSNQIEQELIDKTGLHSIEEERKINELINERASLEIFEIFKRRGGDLSMLYITVSECNYTKNLYLIDEFYNRFKGIIKESYITLNKNNLLERIGKDSYQELVNMVNKYYERDYNISRKNKKQTKEVRQKLVKKMQKKVIKTEDLTKKDLEEYYRQLEQEGKKVRILNDLPENNEENKNSYRF